MQNVQILRLEIVGHFFKRKRLILRIEISLCTYSTSYLFDALHDIWIDNVFVLIRHLN